MDAHEAPGSSSLVRHGLRPPSVVPKRFPIRQIKSILSPRAVRLSSPLLEFLFEAWLRPAVMPGLPFTISFVSGFELWSWHDDLYSPEDTQHIDATWSFFFSVNIEDDNTLIHFTHHYFSLTLHGSVCDMTRDRVPGARDV